MPFEHKIGFMMNLGDELENSLKATNTEKECVVDTVFDVVDEEYKLKKYSL